MGVTVSRMMSRATPATPNTIDGINAAEIEMNSSTQGHGTYFGPLFVVDGNAGRLMNSSRGQTGQAFWDEILNILSGGPGGLNDLAGFGNIYNQLPAPQVKKTTTLQAAVTIQKNTLRVFKPDYGDLHSFEFKFDSMTQCYIHVYWMAKQTTQNDLNGNQRISFTNKDDQFVSPLVFGPFPPGIGQSFVLPISNHFNPQEYLPDETLQRILSAYEKTSSPTSPSPTSPLPQSPISPSAPLLPNGSSRANTNAGPSVSVDVESVPISPVYGADIAESIPSRIFFPLTIVLQADSGTISEANPSNAPLSSQTVNSQISFATIHLGQHSSVESKILKQVLFINGHSYVVQEIFGSADDTDFPDSPKESNHTKDCVICMSEISDTIVMPCRHLCLCVGCADVLRMQGRPGSTAPARNGPPRCPICRQIFQSLLQITLPEQFSARPSASSRTRSKGSIFATNPTEISRESDGITSYDTFHPKQT